MLRNIISIIQVVLGILLVLVIIVQQKGAGLGSAFGGDMGFYRTRRGAEKMFFYATIVLAFLFIISSLIGLIA